jgi:dTMP kinase
VFVVFEGGEGAGKSTQVSLLSEQLRARGHTVVVTREPGATTLGARIRALLLDPAARISPRSEALLYAADRADHVQRVIRPALERGEVVISDRYVDSTLAYQGAGRALPVEDLGRISRWATDGLLPHLTVLLDVPPAVGLARCGAQPDRLEAEPLAFHERVRDGFLDLADRDPGRYLVVDSTQPSEVIAAAVFERVLKLLPAAEPAAMPAPEGAGVPTRIRVGDS